MIKTRATFIELWKKVNPFVSSGDYFSNGENNMYSNEIETALQNSPTGSRAKEMFTKFAYGKGIPDAVNVKFSNGVFLSEVVKDAVDDVVTQNGAFIHTTYKLEVVDDDIIFLPEQPKSLDYNNCRISHPDDDGNEGMIYYKIFNKLDRDTTRREKKRERKYYPFNPDQEVVKAQIEADAKKAGYSGEDWKGKLKHYRGQVMYLNLTPKSRYAVSKFDSVYSDLDTEYRISTYFNTNTRGGFLGKIAVLTQGLDDEQSEDVKEDVQKWLSPEGASGVYHLDVENAEDLDNVLKIVQTKSQLDDKQFSVLIPHLRRNILGAANNLPEPLAFSDSGAMFDSGEKYEQLKKFYWEQCEWERQRIEQAFEKLGHNFEFQNITNDTVTAE